MRIVKTTSVAVSTAASILVILSAISPAKLTAQVQGNNTVWSSSTTIGSSAFIDASAFTGNGTDLCDTLNYIYTHTPAIIPTTGGVIDARGLNGGNTSLTCAASPWNGVTSTPPTTVLLPAATIVISAAWILPNQTRIVGEGKVTTVIQPKSTYSGDLIDMGSASCPSGVCSDVSIEHLDLGFPGNSYTGTNTNNGIVNANSQNNSYVDDVTISNLGGIGLSVSAANSGPYTNIAYGTNQPNPGSTTPCGTSCPVAVRIQSPTRGLHGITCSGDTQTANQSSILGNGAANAAAIQVQANSNTIQDVHTEGFWDGIQIGATANIGSIEVSNVTSGNSGSGGGPVTNTVHICGPFPNTSTLGACASTLTGVVSDVTVRDVLNANGVLTATIQDDITGTTISPTNNNLTGSPNAFSALYALGRAVSFSGVAAGTSLFTANPSLAGVDSATNVATWGSENGIPTTTPCPTGTLFSNTAGAPMMGEHSLYICIGGNTWTPVTTN